MSKAFVRPVCARQTSVAAAVAVSSASRTALSGVMQPASHRHAANTGGTTDNRDCEKKNMTEILQKRGRKSKETVRADAKAAEPEPLLVDAKAAGPELLLPLPNRNSYSP